MRFGRHAVAEICGELVSFAVSLTLARQVIASDTNRWLICCWAHFSQETNVTVNIPTLGAVYVATPTKLTLRDMADGIDVVK
jgi:hypothetical protein